MKRRMSASWSLTLVSVAALLAGSCASGQSVYLHPSADLAAIRRVAVLPLANMTTDQFAAERVREVLMVELLAQGAFDVLEVGEVNRVLRSQGVTVDSDIGEETIKSLGQAMEVQALFIGGVMDFRERRTGTFTAPEIAISLRLVDVDTGIVVWSVADARTGMDMWTRLFGVGEESQTEAVRKLVREIIPTLFEA